MRGVADQATLEDLRCWEVESQVTQVSKEFSSSTNHHNLPLDDTPS